MKPSECIDFINEIEERFPVDEWVVDGIRVWPLIRIVIANKMAPVERQGDGSFLPRFVFRATSVVGDLVRLTCGVFKDHAHNQGLTRGADVVFLGSSGTRQVFTPDGWYDVFSDVFKARFAEAGLDTLALEMVPKGDFRVPRYSGSKFVELQISSIKLKAIFQARLGMSLPCKLPQWEEFIEFTRSASLPCPLLDKKWVLNRAYFVRNLAGYFKKILYRVQPRFGMVVSFYGLQGLAWSLACREFGIPCFDIQHGVAGELHRAYGRWNRVPAEGYELLPSGFWCWGTSDAEAIQSWNRLLTNPHKVFVGGNPWADMWRSGDLPQVFSETLEDASRLAKLHPDAVNILFSMQGEELPKILIEAINASPEHYRWWIRVHPTKLKGVGKAQSLLKDNPKVEVEKASSLPLFALLKNMDVHVTQWSAVVYDAKYFNLPSILINEKGIEYFEKEIEDGLCEVTLTARDLNVAIDRFSSLSRGCLDPALNQGRPYLDLLELL